MTDRTDTVVVTHRTADGRGVRHRYEPAAEGYHHIEEIRTKGGTWRPVGSERVTTLNVETPENTS